MSDRSGQRLLERFHKLADKIMTEDWKDVSFFDRMFDLTNLTELKGELNAMYIILDESGIDTDDLREICRKTSEARSLVMDVYIAARLAPSCASEDDILEEFKSIRELRSDRRPTSKPSVH